MSPADITAGAEFRAGLARRLAEVGLVPAEPATLQLAPLPAALSEPQNEDRQAA